MTVVKRLLRRMPRTWIAANKDLVCLGIGSRKHFGRFGASETSFLPKTFFSSSILWVSLGQTDAINRFVFWLRHGIFFSDFSLLTWVSARYTEWVRANAMGLIIFNFWIKYSIHRVPNNVCCHPPVQNKYPSRVQNAVISHFIDLHARCQMKVSLFHWISFISFTF